MRKLIIALSILSSILSVGQTNLERFEDENSRVGYKDSLGNVVVIPKYFNGSDFYDGLALVALKDKGWTVIDNSGLELTNFEGIPGPIYNSYVRYDLISIENSDEKWGFINRKGELIIPFLYEEVLDFNFGLAPVKLNGLWGFINEKNEIIIAPTYKMVTEFYDGLAGFLVDDKWGFIDLNNQVVIEPKYTGITLFSEGLCAVNNSYFNFAGGGMTTDVINKKGEIIFSGEFWAFKAYKNGIASYWQAYDFGGKEIFIDKNGNELK
jgi:hypothetical protein